MKRFFLIFALILMLTCTAYAEAPPAFSDGEIMPEIPEISKQETFDMADRLSRCGALYFKTENDEKQFTMAAFRLLTEMAYMDHSSAEDHVMGVFNAFEETMPTMPRTAIEDQTQECHNLVVFKDEIIMMEQEVYE